MMSRGCGVQLFAYVFNDKGALLFAASSLIQIQRRKNACMLNAQLNNKYRLAERLGQALENKQASVCTVESCTGGGLAFAITDVPGSSNWLNQSWVTYSNEAKADLVGVSPQALERYGAVSKEVVIEMAKGGRQRAQADYAVAISGIAGPGGGSKGKPVGLVWFAIDTAIDTHTFTRCFSGDRQQVREQAIVLALEKLISCIVNSQ
jgi:nicotinamide-nucleotide amidase